MLDIHFTTTDWVDTLIATGIDVTVIYRYHADETIERNGVYYYFIKDRNRELLRGFQPAVHFHRAVGRIVKEKNISIIHAHNPFSWAAHRALRKYCPNQTIIVQDHAGKTSISKTFFLRWGLRHIDAFLFSSKGQEKPWVENRVISREKCHFIMENASSFHYEDRDAARLNTGMDGKPIFLWVGNLVTNKKPKTVLRAFSKFAASYPEARLYMVYRLRKGESEIKAFIAEDEVLLHQVKMLGSFSRKSLGPIYNSADFLISGSEKEAGGYSVIEAMSCGVIPILTKIPTFIDLTNNGAIGKLYAVGDEDELCNTLHELLGNDIKSQSQRVMQYYEANFSFRALGNKIKSIYKQVSEAK